MRFEFGGETNSDNPKISLPNTGYMIMLKSVKRELQIKKKEVKMKYALLQSFELKHETKYKLPSWRINALEELLPRQIK